MSKTGTRILHSAGAIAAALGLVAVVPHFFRRLAISLELPSHGVELVTVMTLITVACVAFGGVGLALAEIWDRD